ncbi:MAG: hypothetical protein LBV17_01225 [Treponema sp.]|nr:hypothetical protein [Treponema sp.]
MVFFSATFGAGVVATQRPITCPKRQLQPERYEAFKNGGCHIHLSIKYKDKLDVDASSMIIRYRLNKKNIPQYLIDSDKLIQYIKRHIEKEWKIGTVKINFFDKENEEDAVRYACKDIGWGSQIEDALSNAKEGEATEYDKKKLWAHYISKKLNYRRWSSSRNLGHALDIIMNNSIKKNDKLTSIEKDPIIYKAIIPYTMRKSGIFKREFGILESGSDEEKLAEDLLEKETQGNTDINSMVKEILNVNEPFISK